jgi:TM2 domain-containing membrane protein YozV
MSNANDLMLGIPGIEPDELMFLQQVLKDIPAEKDAQFISLYNGRRKKPSDVLIGCILGFIIIGGVQRFMVGQIGMGILYLFTGGLCVIGTIVDTINHKKLAFEFNQKAAFESAAMVKAFQ